MSHSHDNQDFDLPLGFFIGILGGVLAGILFAPKPGRELQDNVQRFVDNLPEEVNNRLSRSQYKCKELMGKTKNQIDLQIEKRNFSKQARRMAEAKQREEMETGIYDY